jgi:hypothetical protein
MINIPMPFVSGASILEITNCCINKAHPANKIKENQTGP